MLTLMGAGPLYRAASVLETNIQEGDVLQRPSLVHAFVTALTPIIEALKAWKEVPEPPEEISEARIDVEALIPTLNDLAVHLDGFSLETEPLMEILTKRLHATAAAPAFQTMEKHMNQYDFKSARRALDALADHLGISLGT